MRLTKKQKELMSILLEGNKNENDVTVSWCDVYQILDRTSYEASREAIICSMRFLEKKGLVERKSYAEVRNNRRKTVYIPTNFAFDCLSEDFWDLEENQEQEIQ